MEFFQEVHTPDFDVQQLKSLVTINNLPKLCASIDTIISVKGNEAEIYCLWGAFDLRREELRYGVRFSLLNCPHSLAWTLTYNESNQTITIHCTIVTRKADTDTDFIDSINVFVEDWSKGITKILKLSH